MNIQEVRKAVAKMKTSLFKNSNSYSIGMLKSHFRGTGLQFKEHQIYVHGDDVRFLDWKILAKTHVPYIKTFDEERNVEIVVVIDVSLPMFSGYNGISKLQAAIELCCLIYLLAKETGDYVHTLIVSDDIINVPKKSGEEGIVTLLSVLQKRRIITPEGHVNYKYVPRRPRKDEERVAAIMKHLSKKREIVLFSDFNDFIEMDIFKKILHKRNVHCFQILSPLDEATKVPYAIYSKQTAFSKKGQLVKIELGGQQEMKNLFGKKFKKLKVHERYLENFIKEML